MSARESQTIRPAVDLQLTERYATAQGKQYALLLPQRILYSKGGRKIF